MKAVAYSDVGKLRKVNEDRFFYTTRKIGDLDNLFILCDGMGGENAGDCASQMAIEYIKKSIELNKGEIISLFKLAIEESNNKILELATLDKDKSGMGTTLVLATIKDNVLYFASIGDSRLYIIDDSITQASKDHTLAEELLSKNIVEKYTKEYNENKHILTRALGTIKDIKADFFEVSLKDEMKILICSDGLSNMLDDIEISKSIQNTTEKNMAKELIDKANENGGKDNISAIVIYDLSDEVGDINAT